MPEIWPKHMNEVDKFFGELPSEDKKLADITEEVKAPTEPAPGKKEEDETESRKNRRHRRLEEQLQKERESNIALNERIKTLSEVERFKQDTSETPTDSRLEEIFGTTEEGKKIAKHFGKILEEQSEKVREETLKEIEERQERVVQEEKEYESLIDSKLESLEDSHDVDLTSDSPKARKARREFLEMVQSLSPKDENGTITEYADFDSTFEIYQKTQNQPEPDTRREEIASRTMQRSSSGINESRDEGPMTFDKAREMMDKQFNS